jgi:hypothetical protein
MSSPKLQQEEKDWTMLEDEEDTQWHYVTKPKNAAGPDDDTDEPVMVHVRELEDDKQHGYGIQVSGAGAKGGAGGFVLGRNQLATQFGSTASHASTKAAPASLGGTGAQRTHDAPKKTKPIGRSSEGVHDNFFVDMWETLRDGCGSVKIGHPGASNKR